MLNTFFFGYLPLKWRRLSRVLVFLISPIPWSLGVYFDVLEMVLGINFWDFGNIIGGICHGLAGLAPFLAFTALISYTLKPFLLVKD